MITHAILSGFVRAFQGLVQAAPTLLVGLLIAAVLRFYLGTSGTRRLFGGQSLRSLPQSWLIGMLLPVCSIGVIPVLREMHRAKVRPGAMTAFALSAPLFNPLSLLYGLTLSRPIVVIAFALASLVVVTTLGLIWDRYANLDAIDGNVADRDADESGGNDARPIGAERLAGMVILITRELSGPSGWYALIAVTGLGFLGAFLPYGALQSSFEMGDPWAPARMTFLAVPVYATPMLAMSQLGMMFQHSNSPGSALALLLLGAGMNLATLLWIGRQYGWKATSVWFGTLILIVLALAYAIERPLVLPGAEPAGHTHAFDIYATPLHPGSSLIWSEIKEVALRPIGLPDLIGFAILSLVAVTGLLFRLSRIDENSWVSDGPKEIASYDRVVPASVLGITLLVGLIAMSVVACFAYYPDPPESLAELAAIRAEVSSAARSGNVKQAVHWIDLWDDWSRRLEVGTFLRTGEVRPYQRMQGYIIRKKLELLEHELEHDPLEIEEVHLALNSLLDSDIRWRAAFRPMASAP